MGTTYRQPGYSGILYLRGRWLCLYFGLRGHIHHQYLHLEVNGCKLPYQHPRYYSCTGPSIPNLTIVAISNITSGEIAVGNYATLGGVALAAEDLFGTKTTVQPSMRIWQDSNLSTFANQ